MFSLVSNILPTEFTSAEQFKVSNYEKGITHVIPFRNVPQGHVFTLQHHFLIL